MPLGSGTGATSSEWGVGRTFEAAKFFVISVLIAAAIQEIAKGMFKYFSSVTQTGGGTEISAFVNGFPTAPFWQYAFSFYVIATMVRHAGAIFIATPLVNPNVEQKAPPLILNLADLALTLGLFIAHFIAALAISAAWTTPYAVNLQVFISMGIVLCIDIVLCIIWFISTHRFVYRFFNLSDGHAKVMNELNWNWIFVSIFELCLVAICIFTSAANPQWILSLTTCLLVGMSIIDIFMNKHLWKSMIDGRFDA